VIERLVKSEQTYVCLWSHAGGQPGHIHYVVQPISQALMDEHDSHGPSLQVAMFTAGNPPDANAVTAFAARARAIFPDVR